MKKDFPVIEVEPSGKKGWSGGAWCLAWVYSTEGNFLLKGYIRECREYIEKRGWKCWVIFNLYHGKKDPFVYRKHRTIIQVFKCDFDIAQPFLTDKKKKADDWKYRIYSKGNWRNGFMIKRLPQQFVNFKTEKLDETHKGTFADNDALKGLKDKLDGHKG